MTERLSKLMEKEEDFEVIERATIEKGFSFHDKAIFIINNGILKVLSIETLTKDQVNELTKCWTIEELEKKADEMDVRTGQPIVLENGTYYDDIFVFDVENGVAKLHTVQKKSF